MDGLSCVKDCLEGVTENLEHIIQTIFGTHSDREPPLPDIPRLNQSLYQFYKPADGVIPNVEVMFFHGLQQEEDASRSHLDAWTSFNGSNSFYWPQQLLAEEFPRAKLLSVSYDSCAKRGPIHGRLDRYCVAENLIQDLTGPCADGTLGHTSGRPLILVGRDMGGLVIKAVCLRANWEKSTSPRYESFLKDIKGILFYCTPHLGFQGLPRNVNGALVQKLGLLDVDTVRLSREFGYLRQAMYKGWRTKGIGSPSIESKFGVPEGSSRYDVDDYYTAPHALHYLSRPNKRTDISYSFLSSLVRDSITQPSSSSAFKSSLHFEIDKNYVPMEDVLKQIRIAFQKSRVVVLHGDSGTGKSSLARHFALCFEKEEAMKKKTDDQGQSITSPVVCYVSCGCDAVVSDIQELLLWIFAVDYPRQDFEDLGIRRARFQQTHRLRTTLANHLRDLHALVILDDVWEPELLENVLVPGANVKYLITTRNADLWPDPNSESVRMQGLNLHDARHIIANYAKFDGGCIPKQFEVQADELIKEVQFYPLALATLGTVLQRGRKFNLDEWTNLRNDLVKYMESGRYKSISFAERYPRSVSAALMLLVNPKFLDDGAMNLLYIITLFQGPEISVSLVKSFLTHSQPSALTDFYMNIKALEALSLVRLERRPILYHSKLLALECSVVWPGETLREAGGEAIPLTRVIVIHEMRQKFIFDKKKEAMDAITGFNRGEREFYFLGNRTDHDWATVLCTICGVRTVREEAQQKMGCLFKWSGQLALISTVLRNWLDLLPLYIEGQRLVDIKSSNETVVTCTEMLWTFLVNRRVDGETISVLFRGRNFTEGMCEFFVEVLALFLVALRGTGTRRQLTDTEMSAGGCLDTLIDFLEEDCTKTTMQRNVLLALIYIITFADLRTNDPRTCLLDTQKLLDRAVMFLSKDLGDTCRLSVVLIAALASEGSAAVIVNVPDCLHKLIGLLAEDVHSEIQESALAAFGSLVGQMNQNTVVSDVLATVTSDLLQRVVTFLSKDMGHRCGWATSLVQGLAQSSRFAMEILSFPDCLDRLVALLAQDVKDSIHAYTLGALLGLARSSSTEPNANENQVKIQDKEDLFDRLVTFLSKDKGERCELSASIIAELAESPSNAANIVKCCSVCGCLAKLVKLLAEDVNEGIQTQALRTLISLTVMANRSRQQKEIHFEMLETTDLLESLKAFLSKDMGSKCTLSASLVAELARAPGIAGVIVNLPGYLEKFARLLDREVEEAIQFQVMRALFSLVVAGTSSQVNEVHIKILESKDLLERVVVFLAKDAGHRCDLAAGFIMGLAAELTRQASTFRAQLNCCLENLVRILADDVDNRIQRVAMATFIDLAMHGGGNQVLTDMLATIMPDLLQRLVMFLSPNMGQTCEDALLLVAQFVLAPRIAVMTVEFSGCLEALVQLLAVDVPVIVQKQALRVLGRLAVSGASVQTNDIHMKMLKTGYLFDRLIMFLSKDMHGRCMLAASAIGSMGPELANQSSTLRFHLSDCLKRLISLLDEDVDIYTQECALLALSRLAVHDDHRKQDGLSQCIDTQAASDLLQRVMMLLSRDKGTRCEKSVFLVAGLARSPFWAEMILNVPCFLDKIVVLLAESTEETIQQHSLEALHRLAMAASSQPEEVQRKMLEAVNLFENLTPFMSSDMGERCELSASVFEELTKAPRAATMIVDCPGCLDKFVQLLAEDVQTGLRSKALRALENLFSFSSAIDTLLGNSSIHIIPIKLLNTKDLFSRVITLLSQESKERCEKSSLLGLSMIVFSCAQKGENLDLATEDLFQGVVRLSSRDMGPLCHASVVALILALVTVPRNRRSIAMFPGRLDELKKLLTRGVQVITQSAMAAISLMPECDKQEIHKMLATEGLMKKLTMALSKDRGWLCVIAAVTIGLLSVVPGGAASIARFPECLDRLVSLLAQDVEDSIQESALTTLKNMASSAENPDHEVLFRMLDTPLLDRLFTYLTKNVGKQCQMAAEIICIFSYKAPAVRPLLAPVPGLIEGFLVLLENDRLPLIQYMARKVLASLPARDKIEKEMSNMSVLPNNQASIYQSWSYENAMLMDYSAALKDINRALELIPESGFLYQERGVLRRLMEDFQGALEDLNMALEIDVDDYEVLKHRALVRYKLGDIEGACKDAERAVLVKPSRVEHDSYGEGCLGVLSVEVMTYKLK